MTIERALLLTALACFAANSVLTRLALATHAIDPATFTSVRFLAAALTLAVMVRARSGGWALLRGGPAGALPLAAYAAPFSAAYLRVDAAVGSLVLFGAVQVTMIGYGIVRGERPSGRVWLGVAIAAVGFLALTMPSVSRPDPLGVVLMAIAGAAWGVYSLMGRGAADPIAANARSFLWCCGPAIIVNLALAHLITVSARGVVLAMISGSVTSAIGYAIWYRVLPRIAMTQAAVAQLSVPVLVGIGADAVLHERPGVRLLVSGAAILGGVALAIVSRQTTVREAKRA